LATLAAPGVSATARSREDVSDHDLVQAVRAGDDHAFERLYHRYHRRIAAYIFGMVRDHGRAEDLTQEVFVSALRRMRQTDRPIAFKPWVYEIAKNASIDAFRRSRRTEEVSYDAEEGLGAGDYGKLVSTSPAPDAAVDHKQQLDHLCGAFGGLSDSHHQILVMRELEGLSYREIGERLGMSRPSVESTLFRARRRLTEEYEELITGERCLRIQAIIAGAGSGALGTRDQRRVGSHISHCQPCRKHARLAGLDAAVMARRPVRAKIAAFLPLPAFLRRRWLHETHDAGTTAVAQHAPALAQLSMTAAQYSEPTMAGWIKATAVAGALAATGIGAGTAVHHARSSHRGAASPPVVTPAAARVAARTAAIASGSATRTPSVAASTGTTGRGTSPAGRSATPDRTSGSVTSAADRASGGAAPGAVPAAGVTTTASLPADTSAPGAEAPADPLKTVGSVLAGSGSGDGSATGSGDHVQQPVVAPDPGAIAPSVGASQPSTVGGAVQQATDTAAGAAGGAAGDAVSKAGEAAGSAADQATSSAGGLLGTK
jgi:RNA polymerase sigma factor (sigma-70 family)